MTRWIECPIHNVVMRVTGIYESAPDSEDHEWVIWRCLTQGCPQIVIESHPMRALDVEIFTLPSTLRRQDF